MTTVEYVDDLTGVVDGAIQFAESADFEEAIRRFDRDHLDLFIDHIERCQNGDNEMVIENVIFFAVYAECMSPLIDTVLSSLSTSVPYIESLIDGRFPSLPAACREPV
jgi:hypothetical protein